MKRLVMLTTVVLMSAGVFAYTNTGAPTAELNQGQWKAGYSYTYFDDDATLHRHYLDLGAGLADTFELNLLLGVTTLKGEGGYKSNNDFSWGFNAKWSFIDAETVDWGVIYQMTWVEADDSKSGVKADVDGYDIQVGVGPTIDMGGWKLYGGGMFYRVDADAGTTVPGLGKFGEDDSSDDWGGFVGATFDIMDNADLSLEYANVGGGNIFGGSINFKF